VPETEPVSQIVTVHMVDSITDNKIHNVILVPFNVILVPVLPISVTPVLETESTLTLVDVHPVT
jgi:hypothetical protein